MHEEAKHFLEYCINHMEINDYVTTLNVLDCGAGDINGNNRYLFKNTDKVTFNYIGVDIQQNTNVDIIAKIHELEYTEYFDIIISSECFEHDMYYEKSIKNIMKMLKTFGLFIFTCASYGRPEHGTYKTSPQDSLTTTINNDEWGNYYKNLIHMDFYEIEEFNNMISFNFFYNKKSKDLYFYGTKDFDDESHIIYNQNIYISNTHDMDYGYNDKNIMQLIPSLTYILESISGESYPLIKLCQGVLY